MSIPEMSLDDLFLEAKKAAKAERTVEFARNLKRRGAKDPVEPVAEPSSLFTSPENWTRTRGLALIHGPTKTLLGNFWELKHKSVKDARRLVRSLEPISVEGVEEVDFGMQALDLPPARGERVVTERLLVASIQLEAPRVSAAMVLLKVEYYDGFTTRAVLQDATNFAEGGEILQLPAGVDILPAMTRECKRTLRNTL